MMICLFFLHVKFIIWFMNTSISHCKFIYLTISFPQCSMTKYWSFCKWYPSPCFKNVVLPLLNECHDSFIVAQVHMIFSVFVCVQLCESMNVMICECVCMYDSLNESLCVCVRVCISVWVCKCEYEYKYV